MTGMEPLLVVNFKAYEQGTGRRGLQLAREIEQASREAGVAVAVAVQAPDIYHVSQEVSLPVFSQHVDPVEFGSHTGSILAEDVKENGARGTLLNHAEHRIGLEEIGRAVEICRSLGLATVVCASSLEEARAIAACRPEYIAFEDPALIGSGIPISKAESAEVREFSRLMGPHGIIPLCGAGISSGEDVKAAVELGMRGVLLSSAVVKADRPGEKARELAEALNGRA